MARTGMFVGVHGATRTDAHFDVCFDVRARGVIHHGDCVEVMASLEPDSIDAIVTDPPYGLGFMGKSWDDAARLASFPPSAIANPGAYPKTGKGATAVAFRGSEYQAWCERWATEAYRVAKPGAYLLAFGGTRTYHRLAAAIEDAGWEIRDTLVWAYASGFPKSLDVSKAIDKAAGAARELSQPGASGAGTTTVTALGDGLNVNFASRPVTAPATPDAEKWAGWGTALKPAWEPIVMARKPLVGTVAANVLRYGTGALNIDATRIPTGDEPVIVRATEQPADLGTLSQGPRPVGEIASANALGRWPPNLLLTDPIFDGGVEGVVGGGETEQPWGKTSRGGAAVAVGETADQTVGRFGMRQTGERTDKGDSGTYSRFFLIPKADRADREPVLGGLPEQEREFDPGGRLERWPDGHLEPRKTPPARRANSHPTVKPTDLMRHLVRLVTPPGGTVLDPFLGSGTTALAAELEGFPWLGIERDESYVAIAHARLNGTQRGLGLDAPAPVARRTWKPGANEDRHPRRTWAGAGQWHEWAGGMAAADGPPGEKGGAVDGVDLEFFPGMAGPAESDEVA